MVIFNSYVSHYQRVNYQAWPSPGSVLWGSATSWLLGKPFEDERLSRLPPAQYFHKANQLGGFWFSAVVKMLFFGQAKACNGGRKYGGTSDYIDIYIYI